MNASKLYYIILFACCLFVYADEEDDDYYTGFLLKTTDIDVNDNRIVYDEEIQEKIDYLKGRGYTRVSMDPHFFDDEIFHMVFNNYGPDERYSGTGFSENDIWYSLRFSLNKPEYPNFYVAASFIVDDVRYWFLKINYFLEYNRIEEWFDIEPGNVRILLIFY